MLSLPWPPSTNNAYLITRGRKVKTQAARRYAQDVTVACATAEMRALRAYARALDDPRFAVTFIVHEPDRRRRDLSNLEKIATDAVFTWLNQDDCRIDDHHTIRAERMKPGSLTLRITCHPRGDA